MFNLCVACTCIFNTSCVYLCSKVYYVRPVRGVQQIRNKLICYRCNLRNVGTISYVYGPVHCHENLTFTVNILD